MRESISLTPFVLFGAGGQFGRLFTRRLIDAGIAVHGVDRIGNSEKDITLRQDEASVNQLVTNADVVLLCVPEAEILAEIPFLAGQMKPGALLIDIASVKSKVTATAKQALQNRRIDYLSIHPMFGPSIDFAGGNMVFITPIESPRAIEFKRLVESWGVTSHTMTSQEHDQATRITQVACHAAVLAYVLVAASSGLDMDVIQKVETPVSRALFALGSRILSGDPELYLAIQRNDGTAAREALITQLSRMEANVSEGEEISWKHQFITARDYFAQTMDSYGELATEMLKVGKSQ